ncbi:hypothetical protein AB0I66_34855 [Streptomyces sp. NPDC050439]|uniref:hypothetical protein n=1 Tax=unclassified Streptomyces TaxID=2593676 RepID=UPI003416D71C
MRQKKLLAATCASAAALALGLTAGGPASATTSAKGVTASFEGKRVDLSSGWGEAKACGVWRDGVKCFRTVAELDRKAGDITRSRAASGALAACSSALQLGEHNDLRGRVLRFYDRGSWQNLDGYSFNDKTSSYRTGACTAHLAEHNGGRGYWYPGNTGPNHYEPSMRSGWNDRVSSIKID